MDEQTAIAITGRVMSDETPLLVEIRITDAWMLVSALQLCTRHPGLSKPMRKHITHVAMQFRDAIVERHPDAEIVLEMGWDSDYDVPFEGQSS